VTAPRRSSRLESFALEGARRRVRLDLASSGEAPGRLPRRAALACALVLFVVTFALRLLVHDPGALIANFYTVPIALLAMVFGMRAGLAAAGFALALVWAWSQVKSQHLGLLGYTTRTAVFVVVGALVGYYAQRLRRDIAERRGAESELEVRAHDLEASNTQLTLAVTQLEAFAQIARAVGGETELGTVLERILENGRAIVGARTLVAYLEQDGELVAAASTDESLAGLPVRLASAEELMGPSTVVVRLRWQGEALGALVAWGAPEGGTLDDEAHELMGSVAASAATAVATAKSVAADRLRHAIQASEEARARWARELHDETLQGLVGLRMLLASARRAGGADSEVVSEALEQTRREIVNLRSLIAELRPAALDELGLGAAIETLSERSTAAAGLEVETSVELSDGGLPRLGRETETTVYRLVQEALSNAVRHSGGAHVRVDVAEGDDAIDVKVADDGHGFDPLATAGGFGLRGMRERVELAGGWMTIHSSGDGSVVRARLPAKRPLENMRA
jgi:signal transduction histidine kinase